MMETTVLQTKVIMIHRLPNPAAVPTSAPPTDIVAVRGDNIPFFVNANRELEKHPPHVERTHPTVLHVSRRQFEEIQWRSNQPFSIAKITEHDSDVEARPFPGDWPRASVIENGMYVVASNLQEPGADGGRPDGKLYKAWIKFEDEAALLDPDFNCNP